MKTWGCAAQATDARLSEYKWDMIDPIPLMYPQCGLCLSAFLRQDDDSNVRAHLSDFADYSEKVMLKAVLGQWRHLHNDKMGIC